MELENSITVSEDILIAIDKVIGGKSSRSEFIEGILRRHLYKRFKKTRDLQDLQIINNNSEYLNKEAEDVLTYHVGL